MQFYFSKQAEKYIDRCDKITRDRLLTAIFKLPFGDVAKLQGFKDEYRLRVGDLRVLFHMDSEIIKVNKVLPRGNAYNKI
ncbi:MAG: type II toxin-antitoxin system RelE/ParE family toxin [Lachnospiraceae bacterium]|nr:type II toxin-antitoxin system RelE/ParE family toxin [Lachnospiraceae bacterium]